jgi:hypothetical protein
MANTRRTSWTILQAYLQCSQQNRPQNIALRVILLAQYKIMCPSRANKVAGTPYCTLAGKKRRATKHRTTLPNVPLLSSTSYPMTQLACMGQGKLLQERNTLCHRLLFPLRIRIPPGMVGHSHGRTTEHRSLVVVLSDRQKKNETAELAYPGSRKCSQQALMHSPHGAIKTRDRAFRK